MSEPMPENEKPENAQTVEPAGTGPVKAAQIAPEAPPPAKKGLFHRLYDRETKLGQRMRAFTRGLGLVVGLFALGLLTTYVLLFQPLERRYRAALVELEQNKTALETLQSDLRLSQNNLAGSEQERKTASTQLEAAEARLDVQRASVKVMETRLALARKDSAAARLALNEVETIVEALKPALSAPSGASLDQVLALVKSDISRDASLADQDLQRLLSELELIDQGLK